MKRVALAVLLTVAQAPSPVPRKAADYSGHGSQNVKANPKGHKAGSAPSMPVHKQDSAPRSNAEASKIAPENTQQPIRVRELPPVSVKKDWADWGVWVFSGLLVIVGFLQVWFLRGTLQAIQRQANIMEKALRLTERADIGLDSAGLSTGQKIIGDSRIILRFKNFGRTQAKNVQSTCYLDIPFPGEPKSATPDKSNIPATTISAGGGQEISFERFRDTLTQDTFEQVRDGKIPVSFRAHVDYEDIFGDIHKIDCRGTLDPKTLIFRYDEYQTD